MLRRGLLLSVVLLAQSGLVQQVHGAAHAEPLDHGAVASDELPSYPPAGHDEQTCWVCLATWQLASAALASPTSFSWLCASDAVVVADPPATSEAAPDRTRRPRAPPAKRLA